MAKFKVGLDYFELDCQLEEKVRLIQAEFGLKGFAVIIKLWQKIYGEFGYYCEWNDDSLLLFMSENGLPSDNKNLISDIVSACVRRNIFSKELFGKFDILTSKGIQERYLNAVSRRGKVEMKKEYLLVSVDKNNNNVVINEDNVCKKENNVCKNLQSREEKSKEEDKKNMCKAEALTLFEQLWKMYPVKKGKGQVTNAAKMRLLKVGYDEMVRAIGRYESELKKDAEWRKPQNGSTFFNSGYIDYLDSNFVPSERSSTTRNRNQFMNYQQSTSDEVIREFEDLFQKETMA